MKNSKYLNQINEEIRLYKVNLINNNLIENYNRILKGGVNMKGIIRNQEQMVKKMNFNSKRKNWTIELLEHYNNCKNKNIGLTQLICTLNKKGLI